VYCKTWTIHYATVDTRASLLNRMNSSKWISAVVNRGHFAQNAWERGVSTVSVSERIMDGIANHFPARNALDCGPSLYRKCTSQPGALKMREWKMQE